MYSEKITNRARIEKIDWQNALRLQRQSHEIGDKNPFLSAVMPMAEYYARIRANQYSGRVLSAQLDEHQFFSGAMQALMEVADKKIAQDMPPEKFRNLCSSAISRRMTDHERFHLERFRKDQVNAPYDAFRDDIKEAIDLRRATEQAAIIPQASIQYNDTVKTVLNKLKEVLGDSQYKVMKAIITKLPQGYNMQDIANDLGKSRSTVESTRSHVRTLLKKDYPQLAAEISNMLVEGDGKKTPARF